MNKPKLIGVKLDVDSRVVDLFLADGETQVRTKITYHDLSRITAMIHDVRQSYLLAAPGAEVSVSANVILGGAR